MENLLQDLRYAMRTLLRAPGFSLIVVISIALGLCGQCHGLQRRKWAAVGPVASQRSGTRW